MKKKILAVLLATGVAATTLLGGSILVSAADDGGNTAQARTLDEIKKDGKIKIGVFSDKNPFGYVDENGDVQGYDIYFGKRLAKDLLGSEDDAEFTYVEAASRVEYLQSAKVDVILANFTVTDDRAEKVDFALPYMKVALGVVSPDDALIKDVKDLEGKKLIVVKGTTAETYFTDNYPDIELVKFDEYQEAYDALLDGRGDAFSTDNTEVLAWAQQNEGFSVGIESLGDIDTIAPAVQKGNTDLLNAINDEIKSLADEQFFHKDFEETLKPVYGDNINPDDLVVEGGVVDSEEKAEDADAAATEDSDAASDDTKDAETTEEPETEELPVQSATILPKHVLVVDDDSILLKITEDMLGRNGVECTTCQNAKEAILALDRLDYDLVLTDIQMPVTDGFGLLRLLRNSDIGNSRTVPVAVMTARGDGDSGVYVKSGFCGCIHKPFSSKGLLAFISSVTEGRSAGMSPFDYSRLMESTDDRRHMFGLVAKESEKDLAELEEALRKTDREAMRRIVHRMAPVWELLGANDVLSGYRKLLHDRISSDETVREYTMRIMKQIRLLIDEVNNELRKKNDGDEKDFIDRGGQPDSLRYS